MCHSRLPTPETTFSLCASTRLPAPRAPENFNASTHGNGEQVSGNGGQVDRREKSYLFTKLYRKDFSLAQTGFFYGAGYYSRVAPLAQTGMTGADVNAKAVAPLAQTGMRGMTHLSKAAAPGRAGRALRSK
jgi:hypothetical protein